MIRLQINYFTVRMTNNGTSNAFQTLKIIHPIHEDSTIAKTAFAHALAMAHSGNGELEIIDVRDSRERRKDFSVRTLFEKWSVLKPNSERSDVAKLGLKITKIIKRGQPKKIIGHRMEKHRHDLLVIGTQRHRGISKFFDANLADYLANEYRQTTLYIPENSRFFVDENNGNIALHTILLPVAKHPSADYALGRLQSLLSIFAQPGATIIGLHCGEQFPSFENIIPQSMIIEKKLTPLPVVKNIIKTARERNVDLIVMATQGRNTFPKKIIGSLTEQVLADAPCPVLSIPVD